MANELLQPGIRSGYEVNGPAAGVMADQQYADWQAMQGRVMRDSDLANQMNQNAFQNQLLDNPVKAAERDLKTQQIAGDVQALPSKIEQQIAENVKGKTDAQLKVADDRATFLYQSAQAYPKDLFSDPAGQARGQRIWEEQKAQAKEMGVKFPEGDFSPAALQDLQQRGQASGIYLRQRQEMELEKAKTTSAEKIANIGATSRVEAAKYSADAIAGRQQAALPDVQRLINEMDLKVKSGQPLTEDDINKVKTAYKQQRAQADQATLKPMLDQMSAAYLADPKLAAATAKSLGLPSDAQPITIATMQYERQLDKQASEWVKDRFPGATVSKGSATPAANVSTTPKSASTMKEGPAPDDKTTEAVATKTFGTYDTTQYEYVYAKNPQTGRIELARKAKVKK